MSTFIAPRRLGCRPPSVRFLVLVLVLLVALLHILLQAPFAPDYTPVFAAESAPSSLQRGQDNSRYISFHQVTGVGFNNQLQEIVILAQLSLLLNRTYVFHHLTFRDTFGKDKEAPMTVFVESLLGGEMVSEEQWARECEGRIVDVSLPEREEGTPFSFESAVDYLRTVEHECVRVTDWVTRWNHLELDSALSLWPNLESSLPNFMWSQGLQSAMDRVLDGMKLGGENKYMAIHLRRGDFEDHCTFLANETTPFMLWNRLPGLPDPLSEPRDFNTTFERCFPSREKMLTRIIDAVRDYTETHPNPSDRMTTVYVLHDLQWNTPLTWFLLQWLKNQVSYFHPNALVNPTDSRVPLFDRFVDTMQMRNRLSWQESDFAVMADLELARRADVFLGNGFSSLTSDVTMMRLADGKDKYTIRFW